MYRGAPTKYNVFFDGSLRCLTLAHEGFKIVTILKNPYPHFLTDSHAGVVIGNNWTHHNHAGGTDVSDSGGKA
jgi:hypothetical protein